MLRIPLRLNSRFDLLERPALAHRCRSAAVQNGAVLLCLL